MRLIDADKLKKELDEWALYITGEHAGKSYDRDCVNFIIDYMPTVDEPVDGTERQLTKCEFDSKDVVEVVRCKDCKRYERCEVFNTFDMDEKDFCSKAVKVR